MLHELSAQERSRPYSKYFYEEPARPPEAKLLEMAQPIDSSRALPIERLNDILNPGYLESEAGWCILPNGAGYVANITAMPEVSVEMVNWWFAWHSLESLRYKIWSPQSHFGISISDEDREKVLKRDALPTEKFQGLTHHVVEDIGCGTEEIAIRFLKPEETGLDMSRFKPPHIGTIVSANGLSRPAHAPAEVPPAPAFMCHAIREVAGGIEFRTRFWLGYHMTQGKPRLLLPAGARVPEEFPRGLALHNVHEYTNLAALLPRIYGEQGPEVA